MGKRVVIYGASGFIGSRLAALLAAEGMKITGVSRSGKGDAAGVSQWVKPGEVDLSGCDAVVNLAGAPIDKRWTEARRREFEESRAGFTKEIVARIAELPAGARPELLLNASAVGIYGNRGDELLDEGSTRGTGYLADLCARWEAAAGKAEALGLRVVAFRIGVVLGKDGSAFEKLLKVFRAGIGGRLGDGRQWMPWIHVDDLCGAMLFAIQNEKLSGAVNGTAPEPERNADLTRELAAAVSRPAFLPVPGFALKLILGDFAEVLLAGQRAFPKKLELAGFRFRFRKLGDALGDLTA